MIQHIKQLHKSFFPKETLSNYVKYLCKLQQCIQGADL